MLTFVFAVIVNMMKRLYLFNACVLSTVCLHLYLQVKHRLTFRIYIYLYDCMTIIIIKPITLYDNYKKKYIRCHSVEDGITLV